MHQIMTKEAAEAYRAKFAKDTQPWGGGVFQHFATPEEWQRHLDEVKQLQQSGQVAF